MFFQRSDKDKASRDLQRLETLRRVTESIALMAPKEDLFNRIVEAGVSLCDATHAYLLLANPASPQLVYAAGTEAHPRSPVPLSSISGAVTCFRSKKTTEVPDAETCPFVDKELVARRGQKAALYVPIVSGEACMGVLEIEDRSRKRTFSNGELPWTEHLARLAATALRYSEQREMREQLQRSEKLAAVSELAGAIAAELDAPFKNIAQTASGAAANAGPEELKARLDEVGKQIKRAAASVDRLVRFANPAKAVREEFDLNAMLRDLVAALRQHKSAEELEIKLGLSKRAPLVYADPTQLRQIFQILLQYGLHFVEKSKGKTIQIHTARRDNKVVVSMTPGGAVETTSGSVDSSSRQGETKANGSLGIAICQGLIERAGGSLVIERGVHVGFRIEVEYPLARDPWTAGQQQQFADMRTVLRPSSMTVLVIEPDTAVQDALVRHLTDQGYRVIPTSTGDEALALAERMRFEWVFCDLHIQPISAAELYDKLFSRVERFIFMADETSAVQNSHAFTEQGRSMLKKPFTGKDIDKLIEYLLRTSIVMQDG